MHFYIGNALDQYAEQNRTEQAGPAVTFEMCIRKMPGSNLGWITDYPDLEFSWFSLATPSQLRGSTSIRPVQLPFKSIIIH
jgi:hypothetical protein